MTDDWGTGLIARARDTLRDYEGIALSTAETRLYNVLCDCADELAHLTKELEQSRQGERLLAEVSGKHSDEVIRLTKELKFMQNEAEEWLQKAEANAKDAERLDWMEKNRDDIVVQQRLDVDGGHPWRIYDTRSHRSTVGRSLREAIDFAFQQQPATPTEQETTT